MRLMSLLLVCVACADKTEPVPVDPIVDDTTDSELDTVVDSDPLEDTDTAPPIDTGVPIVDFEQGSFRVTSLQVMQPGTGIDQDGDGDIDNALPELLVAVDASLPGDMSPADVNARLERLITDQELHVLIEARHDGSVLSFDVLTGMLDDEANLRVTAGSYDDLGLPRQRLSGAYVWGNRMRVGPGPVGIPIQFLPTEPVVTFNAETAFFRGQLDDAGVDTFLSAAFTVEDVMNDAVVPLIENFVTGGDRDDLVATAQGLLDLFADVVVNGQPALSTTFQLQAEPATWLPAE